MAAQMLPDQDAIITATERIVTTNAPPGPLAGHQENEYPSPLLGDIHNGDEAEESPWAKKTVLAFGKLDYPSSLIILSSYKISFAANELGPLT